jgi:hypothetical protein
VNHGCKTTLAGAGRRNFEEIAITSMQGENCGAAILLYALDLEDERLAADVGSAAWATAGAAQR